MIFSKMITFFLQVAENLYIEMKTTVSTLQKRLPQTFWFEYIYIKQMP